MPKHLWIAVAGFLLVALLGACVASPALPGAGAPPTVSELFNASHLAAQAAATAGPLPTRRPTRTPLPPAEATATAETELGGKVVEWVIYDDGLDPDWTAEGSWGINLDLASRAQAYSGTLAASVGPTEDYGAFFLALKPDATRTLPLADVLGVSVWLNGGADGLAPDDLAITVIGSNDYTYWTKDDASVELKDPRPFSESRLVHLGMERSLAPNTWTEIVVRLDRLLYQPDFNYVTGVYVKNDAAYRQTYYVDRVAWQVIDRSSSK